MLPLKVFSFTVHLSEEVVVCMKLKSCSSNICAVMLKHDNDFFCLFSFYSSVEYVLKNLVKCCRP